MRLAGSFQPFSTSVIGFDASAEIGRRVVPNASSLDCHRGSIFSPRAGSSGSSIVTGPAAPLLVRRGSSERRVWQAMIVAVALETVIGFVELRTVALGRPSGWDPIQGRALYLAHAALGGAIGVVAILVAHKTRAAPRVVRLGSLFGIVGIGVAGAGGVLAVYHEVRLVGMAFMFIGAGTAVFGYFVPLAGRTSVNESG